MYLLLKATVSSWWWGSVWLYSIFSMNWNSSEQQISTFLRNEVSTLFSVHQIDIPTSGFNVLVILFMLLQKKVHMFTYIDKCIAQFFKQDLILRIQDLLYKHLASTTAVCNPMIESLACFTTSSSPVPQISSPWRLKHWAVQYAILLKMQSKHLTGIMMGMTTWVSFSMHSGAGQSNQLASDKWMTNDIWW